MAPALLDFDKPGAFTTTTTTKISVRFVLLSPFELPIKNQQMKTSPTDNNNSAALLQLAAHLENFAQPAASQMRSQSNRIPLALLPEKLESSLKGAKPENHFYVAARAGNRRIPAPATTKRVPPGKKIARIFENPLDGLRNTEFRMEAPFAKSVQLAGDFTDWEKSPLDLVQSYDGTWFTIVPLLPGIYSYRFIVDGQWFDDPESVRHVPNPFGSEDAIMNVC